MSGTRPLLELHALRKGFRREGGAVARAVDDIDLSVGAGEFIVLLGPSGCGKTTLLRCVAGLEQPDSGRIVLRGHDVFNAARGHDVPSEQRRIGMVFQSYALWPHMTVFQNIAYPLKMRGVSRSEQQERVRHILGLMNLRDLESQFPGQISGGQQQRVALARALVCGDDMILFDEPLSNVDAKVREALQLELLEMQRRLGFTALYVTHDQHEAMMLATRIAVLAHGRIAQLGTPQEIYLHPQSYYVGDFVGATNRIPGHLTEQGGLCTVDTGIGKLDVLAENVSARHGKVVVLSRPERWSLATEKVAGNPCWKGIIRAAAFVGYRTEYLVDIDGTPVKIWEFGKPVLTAGTRVFCGVDAGALLVFDDV